VSPVRYKLGFYIPEDSILHSHRRENLKSYIFKDIMPALYTSALLNIPPALALSAVCPHIILVPTHFMQFSQ
jgi:hypothetical protein